MYFLHCSYDPQVALSNIKVCNLILASSRELRADQRRQSAVEARDQYCKTLFAGTDCAINNKS